jgi:hypothetical protein
VNLLRTLREAASPAAARLALVLPALLLLAAPAPLSAPRVLQGSVSRDGHGAAGVRVQLHRVTRASRGQIDSTLSGPGGAFRLTLPPVDTAAGFTVFFTTAVADGVRYFGPAVHPDDAASGYTLVVYDTTSAEAAADSVRISRRDLFLIPGMDGSMEVAEVVRLRNLSHRTLLSDRTPRVAVPLPRGAEAFEAGEGDRADSAASASTGLVRMGDRAWVTDPLIPGDRDFFFRYRLPAAVKRLPVALGRATDTLFVYVRQPAPDVVVRGAGQGAAYSAEGEPFVRYRATGLGPASAVALDWRGPAPPPVDPRWAALAITGTLLAAGALLAVRRGRTAE